jgi:RNA binding exosome subunit
MLEAADSAQAVKTTEDDLEFYGPFKTFKVINDEIVINVSDNHGTYDNPILCVEVEKIEQTCDKVLDIIIPDMIISKKKNWSDEEFTYIMQEISSNAYNMLLFVEGSF